MKNNIASISIFLLCICTSVNGQRRKVNQLPNFDKKEIHWGFYLGWNNTDYKVTYKESDFPNTNLHFDHKTGFNVGLIADMKINENFNLRIEPGLLSNASTLTFVDKNFEDGNSPTNVFEPHTSTEIASTYLHVPVLIKASALRLNNIKPYIIGGFSYDYNFSSNQDSGDDNFSGQFRMQTHNFMYEIGLGMDIYFHYFKFSPSIRGQFAMTNEIYYDEASNGPSPWTDPINFMGSRSFFIKLAFE